VRSDNDFGLWPTMRSSTRMQISELVPCRWNRAGIEDFVARFEESDIGADGIDDAGGVVAQDLGFTFRWRGALADLVIEPDWPK